MKDIKLGHYAKGSPMPSTTFAWVGVEATGVKEFDGERCSCKPSEGNLGGEGPFASEQWIKVLEADKIKLFAKGGDKMRNTATQEITIVNGSIRDYYGAGYGGEADWLDILHGGFSQQIVGHAEGEITISHSAYNNECESTPNVKAVTKVVGSIDGYSARSQVARFVDDDLVEAELNYEALQAVGRISHVHEARSRDGDWATCKLNISQGGLIALGGPCMAKIDGKDWSHTIAEMKAEVDPRAGKADYRTSYRNPGIAMPISQYVTIPKREVIICRARQS